MSLSAEKLAEIDAELESFGKSDDELAAVVGRARAMAADASGDAGLAELLEGLDEAVAAARAVKRPRPPLPTGTAVGHAAPETTEEEIGSGLIEIPESEIRKADLPPVLELGPKSGETDVAQFGEEQTTTSGELEQAFEEGAGSDISGLSVDELFADAAPSAHASESSDLTDLFEDEGDEEAIRLSDPEIELEALEARADKPAPRPRTMPPPLPPRAAAKKAPKVDSGAFRDEETDETIVGSLADLTDDDSFELLVDEDVLELEDEAPAGSEATDTAEGAAEPNPDEGDGKGGLISRILGRK